MADARPPAAPDNPYASGIAQPGAPATGYRTTPDDTPQMPPGIGYIVGNEAAERFSYYGMKAILTVFMTQYLVTSAGEAAFTDTQAKAAVAWFGMAVYATPLLGALLADLYWGKYPTIIILSLVYCLGHAVLALIDVPIAGVEPWWVLVAGLGIISLGAGGIKPCVSSHVGDQFGRKNQGLMTRVYGWFYFSINFGSTFSQLLTPLLLASFGAAWAFGVPGILMAVATLVFWLGRNKYVHIPPRGKEFLREAFGPDGRRALLNLTPLLLFAAPFWCLFDQTASAWVLQARDMDRTLLSIGVDANDPSAGFVLSLDKSQLQAVNPIFVMILVPLFAYVVYPAVGRVINLTPLRKIAAGMAVAAGSFAIAAVAQAMIDAGETPSAWWQVLAYFVLTIAEVLVSVTLLEFFYTQAPKSMKSFIMSIYLLSVSLGNFITAMVNVVIERENGPDLLEGAAYYWFFVGLMLVNFVGFALWSRSYRGKTYMQGDEQPAAAAAAAAQPEPQAGG